MITKSRHFTWLLLGLIVPSVGFVFSGVPTLTSDKPIVFDHKTNSSLAEGNADFNYDDLCLQAHRIYFYTEEAKAVAERQVKLTKAELRLVAHWGQYYLRDKRIDVPKFRLEVKGHGISGDHLNGTFDCLYADNVNIYLNGKNTTTLNIHGRSGVLCGHEYIELHDAVFKIGCVPLLYAPCYRHYFQESPLRWTVDCGLIRRDKDFGRYIRNDLVFNLGWPVRPGLMLDYYRKRDCLLGGILEYETDSLMGRFKGARIHDAYVGNLENPRFFIDWRHRQSFGEKTDFVTQIEWLKDADVIKDFRPDDHDGTRQHPDNFAELAHRTDDAVASALLRYRFNNFQRIQERLPELHFDYLPVKLGNSPIYHQWGLGLSHLRELPTITSTNKLARELKRADVYWGASIPCDLSTYCTFTPMVETRAIKYWGLSNTSRSTYERLLGQFGFDLRFKTYGEYAFENEYWNIHGFRHLCMPVVQYRYLPSGHGGSEIIPAIDRENEDVGSSLYEIDLLNRRDLDAMNDMHLVRVGLENYLFTNYKTGQAKQWLRCNFYQDIRVKRVNDQNTLSDFFIDTEWSPSSFFSWNTSMRIDPKVRKLQEIYTSVSLHENDLWSLSLSQDYKVKTAQRSLTNQTSLSLAYRLNHCNVLRASLSIDDHTPDLLSQTYSWETIVDDTWKIDTQFKWKKWKSNRREHNSWEIRWLITFVEG